MKGPPPVMKDFGHQTVQEMDCQTMTSNEAEQQTEVSPFIEINHNFIQINKVILKCIVKIIIKSKSNNEFSML